MKLTKKEAMNKIEELKEYVENIDEEAKDNIPLTPKELRKVLADMYTNLPDSDDELIKTARNMYNKTKVVSKNQKEI